MPVAPELRHSPEPSSDEDEGEDLPEGASDALRARVEALPMPARRLEIRRLRAMEFFEFDRTSRVAANQASLAAINLVNPIPRAKPKPRPKPRNRKQAPRNTPPPTTRQTRSGAASVANSDTAVTASAVATTSAPATAVSTPPPDPSGARTSPATPRSPGPQSGDVTPPPDAVASAPRPLAFDPAAAKWLQSQLVRLQVEEVPAACRVDWECSLQAWHDFERLHGYQNPVSAVFC